MNYVGIEHPRQYSRNTWLDEKGEQECQQDSIFGKTINPIQFEFSSLRLECEI